MATEPAAPSKRPSPLLLALLGLTVVAAAAMKLMGSASPGTAASNSSSQARAAAQARPDPSGRPGGPIDPSVLDVHLEVLEAERPAATEAQRNPFRFRPPPAPPPPPPAAGKPSAAPMPPPMPTGPPPPPPPPPITVKFIGLLDRADGTRLAVFSDCSAGRRQSHAKEGETVDGRYRLVKIGRESVIIEHLDGRGRTTLASGGQECVK
jgi:hypothetical protein